MSRLQEFISKVCAGKELSRSEAAEAFHILMSGEADAAQIGGFLIGLQMRGETIDEITGAAEVMREKVLKVEAPANAIDTCGTGGDASGTYNISTCAAFVVAGAGVPVAKHGNKSISSKSGSADVLTALGVNLDVSPEVVTRSINEAGIGFMFAPAHHSAMRHVGPARAALGVRTIFNLLGPLSNPAGVSKQIIGVFDKKWIEPMAHVLKNLGSSSLWVVHGEDGLDELTTTGSSYIAALSNGEVSTFTITPEDAGLERVTINMIKGGDSQENAAAINKVLNGEMGPFRDIVLLNAGAALVVSGVVDNIKAGVNLAAQSIDQGKAKQALEKLVTITST